MINIPNLIDFNDLSVADWDELCRLGSDIIADPAKYAHACAGKVMATLFYEPSTRTQLSFQTAMIRLGGSCIGFSDPKNSSVSKGESLRDTIKIVSNYADIAVMRNPVEGSAYAASMYSRVPLVNAGDGGHLHPTQTMADMFTIMREKGRYEGLAIGLCGDLLNGRTVHSLMKAFSRYKNNTFYFISTNELRMPDYIYDIIKRSDNRVISVNALDGCISKLDILYMTRIQRERFASEADYRAQSGIFVLTEEKLRRAKDDLTILHPLPKVDEIEYEVDDDPRAKYFAQAENGLYIRMALIYTMLAGSRGRLTRTEKYPIERRVCRNPRCVAADEPYLPALTYEKDGRCFCRYCDCEL